MDTGSTIVVTLRHICENLGMLIPRPPRSFRFLDLPAEIRLLIYQELFGGIRAHIVCNWEEHIIDKAAQNMMCDVYETPRNKVHGQMLHLGRNDASCCFHSAVLRTCRTVYDKTLPVLYANPIFDSSIGLGPERFIVAFSQNISAGHLNVPPVEVTGYAMERNIFRSYHPKTFNPHNGSTWDISKPFTVIREAEERMIKQADSN
ncbi:hypothetical protein BU25DRAFT_488231 [Macroventuria anomochaeta]|uniref:Uncharacterized protein n=1 Tax=Macroventuria anomochaeta TaxID=301207 RepID=A0ACB6SDI2_9PLEO|nr:uncharacterized protein BU25DRAFT_488231 [Macroventuria anomochaeta]KAF2631660.1 hypothetical protein BU25DRAFT_488231 [Macroventuria anomochaeta]